MSSLEVKARLRREQDILDRIDNVKRLIQMKTTLMTAEDASNYGSYKWYSRSDGKAFGAELINDLSEVIQLQLLSIVALCNGDNPDLGEPCPMLEWQSMSNKQKNIRQIGFMMCGKSALDGMRDRRMKMNREILFRAKAINRDERYETRTRYKNGDWVYGLVSRLGSEKYDLPMEMTNTDGTSGIDVDRKTVGQYTGLTDKNNVRIFEGDIITCVQNSDGNLIDRFVEIGYVEMKYGAFGLHRKQGYYRPFKDWLEDYEYEVIGSIYDNPELMEDKENE